MSLTDAQRARFARHLLLPELGEAGQLRLLQSRVRPSSDSDVGAWEVARNYLERAGVRCDADAEEVALVAPSERVAKLAGRAELTEAARALAGAFAAVETIKSLTGMGSPSELPESPSLVSEEA